MKRIIKGFLLCAALFLCGCSTGAKPVETAGIPAFGGAPYEVLENNMPDFSDEDLGTEAYKAFSSLDDLKRPGQAEAVLGPELLPRGDREDISFIYPPGWEQEDYDFVDGGKLYNRSHLLAWSLTGENANPQNLITGTRYMNAVGMQPFENEILDYIRETGNHVRYEVTPVYTGDNLVADGVIMQAFSVEDQGQGISFHVFCHNVQPGVEIDYATGESRLADNGQEEGETRTWVVNTRSLKFHSPECPDVENISNQNKEYVEGTLAQMKAGGYSPHKECTGS